MGLPAVMIGWRLNSAFSPRHLLRACLIDCVAAQLCLLATPTQDYLSHVLLPHGLIMDRIEKLACDIRTDMPDSTPHLLVVLKGGSEFGTDLSRAIRKRHLYSGATHLPFTVDYIRVKSYEGTESTGNGERARKLQLAH